MCCKSITGVIYDVNLYFIVAAQEDEDPTILIVHPDGQNVELKYDLRQLSANETAAWIIGQSQPQGVGSLAGGLVTGYSANIFSYNLIIRNIMMNDDRNGTLYQCVIGIQEELDRMAETLQIIQHCNITILYVAGECFSVE